ncbi:hypothetical protein PAERUG_E5_London_17_VIM_2_12_12_00078 [Pseudomonas aeruginosa]|nr:hypothetical protein PAERUG_E5_London_17_VIM_2_12_12_00078 [Pseudomonas aeruginosa]
MGGGRRAQGELCAEAGVAAQRERRGGDRLVLLRCDACFRLFQSQRRQTDFP